MATTNQVPAASSRTVKLRELVQVPYFDEAVHWLYARVMNVSDEGILVRVDHPGNPQHDDRLLFDISEIRTKADVEQLLALANDTWKKTGKAHKVSQALRSQDPWIEHALKPTEKGPAQGELGLHKLDERNKPGVIAHYEAQLKRLSGGTK